MNSKILQCFIVVIFLCASLCGYGQGKVTRPTNQQSRTSNHKTSRNVTISEPDGYINGHGYVDLGLPSGVKWATSNIGGSNPCDNGNYYAWSETATKSVYSENNSQTHGKSLSELYSDDIIDSSGNLTIRHDAASANWGANWRMPRKNEFDEIINLCKCKWVSYNEKNGILVIGPNNKSIFFPAGGNCYECLGKPYNNNLNQQCYYWSAGYFEHSDGSGFSAHYFGGYGGPSTIEISCDYVGIEFYGLSVRPVSDY